MAKLWGRISMMADISDDDLKKLIEYSKTKYEPYQRKEAEKEVGQILENLKWEPEDSSGFNGYIPGDVLADAAANMGMDSHQIDDIDF